MINRVVLLISLLLNIKLMYVVLYTEKISLTNIAVNSKNSRPGKDYKLFYESYGVPFNNKMNAITGDDLSFLYDLKEHSLFLFDSNGPIISYVNNDINIYAKNFNGSFYDRSPGVASLYRGTNFLSYYNGTELKVGELNSFPEAVYNVLENTIDDSSSMNYILNDSRLDKIYKNGKRCLPLNTEISYFACCAVSASLESKNNNLAEGFVYRPFNNTRWGKIGPKGYLSQEVFDQACHELYKSGIEPDLALSKKLGAHFFDSDLEGFKEELRKQLSD